eukprot:NODE_2297_length_1622_cov_47.554370_g1969_i0.p1 GENE.NODE_2297_length_1622_cov_47.554370_g1969_i0~~NODE_2297_length_1622_cov_47.554370_g1969_i0.p1  ORF type:complete len:528 (-),score=112.35 NODE_2297_length_1622_cov_47.554370_g1969_i0:39-1403(-)
MSAGESRLDVLSTKKLPYIVSLGGLDMVNFGPINSVPEKYKNRKLHSHNSNITLMRTSKEEAIQIGKILSSKINSAIGPVVLLIPEKGLSQLDSTGNVFYDPEVNEVLFKTLEENITINDDHKIQRVPHHINDPEFVEQVLKAFHAVTTESTDNIVKLDKIPVALSTKYELIMRKADPSTARGQIIQNLRNLVLQNKPIIGAGAGTGISAKFEEVGGVDLIVIYNSGRFRMAGHGSLAGLLPYKDANAIVLEMGEEILPVVHKAPVLAGVCATDPFRRMPNFLAKIKEMGFAGVQNFPTVGLIDGTFRLNLEETGMGFDKEIEMIGLANKMDLLTTPYAFDPEQARRLAAVGADIIVAHMGLTTSGSIGAHTAMTLDDSVRLTQAICDAAKSVNPDILVITHGGPIAMPEDADYVLQRTKGVHGFYGASSAERLPTEIAIRDQMKKFKSLSLTT